MNHYLIAIDIDGTLRHDDGIITNASKEIIKMLKLQGETIVLCTARPRYHAKEVNIEIGGSDEIICLNGAEIYNSRENKIIHETFIDPEHVKILFQYAIAHNIRIMFSVGDDEYVSQFTRNDYQTLLTDQNKNIIFDSHVKESMITCDDKKKIEDFKNLIEQEYNMNVFVSSNFEEQGKEMFFVVASEVASKGYALCELAKHLNMKKDQIICFGNDNNDISMFQVSATAVAVANATKELLANATDVTDSNNEDGVYKYLKKLVR